MSRFYLAYDVLLNPTRLRKICPFARIIDKTFLEDYQMYFKGRRPEDSYLTIVKEKGCKVPVTLYQLTSWDEYRLDNYKLLNGKYQKAYIPFTIKNKQEKVLTYTLKEDLESNLPFFYEISELRNCYRDLGIEQSYIDKALMATEKTRKRSF